VQKRPNILLVLLDDVGFMDFGVYGSDTATPNIDKLGRSGAMLTRYYTHPLCGPSRAALLTGQDNHLVGAGTLAEALTDDMRTLPAYSMRWKDNQKTIASRLKQAGYQTFVAGKWGIGDIGANLPHRYGFDRSWVLDATGASNYQEKPYLPLYTEVKWFEDGQRISLPPDFYSSKNIVDKMIQYVDEASRDQPFFGYLSFQALHMPVQVPREFVEKYDGVFDRGWDAMRRERLQRAIDLGLVPAGTRLAPDAHGHRAWDSLSDKEKAYWSRVMQVNAGMMEAADFHLGRLLDHLDESGELQNTVVIVTSDNGPEYNTIGKTAPPARLAFERLWMGLVGWNTHYESLGQRDSLAAIGQEWAAVSAAPFHLFKFSTAEGGLRVPMVVAGPDIRPVGLVQARSQVTDIAPTLLDAAAVRFDPDEFYGRSLMPLLAGQVERIYDDSDSFAFEVSGTAALYRGQWKLTKTPTPYGNGEWHLYDVTTDPGETTDLSAQRPALLRDMVAEYEAYAHDVGVYQLPAGETAANRVALNSIKKASANYWYLFVGLFAVSLAALLGVVFFLNRLTSRRCP
jgi:arylsulfatase/uncharacterized sulfatase